MSPLQSNQASQSYDSLLSTGSSFTDEEPASLYQTTSRDSILKPPASYASILPSSNRQSILLRSGREGIVQLDLDIPAESGIVSRKEVGARSDAQVSRRNSSEGGRDADQEKFKGRKWDDPPAEDASKVSSFGEAVGQLLESRRHQGQMREAAGSRSPQPSLSQSGLSKKVLKDEELNVSTAGKPSANVRAAEADDHYPGTSVACSDGSHVYKKKYGMGNRFSLIVKIDGQSICTHCGAKQTKSKSSSKPQGRFKIKSNGSGGKKKKEGVVDRKSSSGRGSDARARRSLDDEIIESSYNATLAQEWLLNCETYY